jgi:hypothetical protein
MEEKRSDLAEKLEALESQVAETVQSATEVVGETVEAVKETVENVTSSVEETVQSVGNFFDLRHQTEERPWIVFGGSVVLGCLAAQLFGGKKRSFQEEQSWSASPPPVPKSRATMAEPAAAPPARSEERSSATNWLWDEVGKIKGLALGALMGVVRDMAAKSLPGELGKRVADEVDKITTKMGGEPFHGSVLPEK